MESAATNSPFPGMDPYLEDPAYWQDFHSRFINACSEVLSELLPDAYEARIDERLRLVERTTDRQTTWLPDVAITDTSPSHRHAGARASAAGAFATLEPVAIPMGTTELDEVRESWIEILHRPDRSLVTAIEILSPTNKSGAGYFEYRNKRVGIINQGAHLVEIDLLLTGRRLELKKPLPDGNYYAYVTRDERRPLVDVYAWSVRDPLPTIPVPLKAPDPDIGLDIAEVFAITYRRGRYARSLRYDAAPVIPIGGELLAWTRQHAQAAPPPTRPGEK